MIARLRILLPFNFSVRQGDELPPHEFIYGEYRVRIYPPCQAAVDPADVETLSPVPLRDIIEQLRPADVQTATHSIRMDDAPTIQANLLQIDFLKADFDRRRILPPDVLGAGDPPIRLVFELANGFLARVRTVTRGSEIKPASPGTTKKLFRRFKADEASQTITARIRRLSPEDNNERQPIHEHVSVEIPESPRPNISIPGSAGGQP